MRKLCRDCKKVLDYLAISEVSNLQGIIQENGCELMFYSWIDNRKGQFDKFKVIETMEDLVQFVKDLSPCLSKVRLSRSQNFGIFLFETDWKWSCYANHCFFWEGSSSYLGWGCLNRSLRYLSSILTRIMFWAILSAIQCFFPRKMTIASQYPTGITSIYVLVFDRL